MSNDPMHQFHIAPLSEAARFSIGGWDASFTNASLFMVAGTALAVGLMLWGMKPAAMTPGRGQTAVETLYGFVHSMVKDNAGEEGLRRFFPLIFTIFMFVFMGNMLGMYPYWFSTTGQVIVPATLALIVFSTVLIVGFAKNGLKFLKLFAPSGVPLYILWFVAIIEIISFFSRPLSHTVRLWANIFAGHILLKVFAGFVPMMASAGTLGVIGSVLPLAMTTALYALEILVAFLQAYVFAMLTTLYFNDALHPGH